MKYPFSIQVISPTGAVNYLSYFIEIALTQVFEERMVFVNEQIAGEYCRQVSDAYVDKGCTAKVVNVEKEL